MNELISGWYWAETGFLWGVMGVTMTALAMYGADRSKNHYQANLMIFFMSLYATAYFGMNI